MITRFDVDGILVAGGATGVVIRSNWVGSDGTGAAAAGNGDDGIDLNGADAIIHSNVVNNSGDEGIDVRGARATITGNIIGLEADGTTGAGNYDVGIALFATDTTIGGTAPGAGNVISMNWEGIEVNTSDNTIQGNLIGTDATGLLDRGSRIGDGIEIQAGTGNLIGGTNPVAANVIAHNQRKGVDVTGGADNAVLGNSIHSNGGLGIDLGPTGVTPNSNVDAWLNYPEITSVTESGGILTITGTYDVPAGDYRFEIFKNPSGADPSGHGEGEQFVGTSTLTHPGTGPAPWGAALPGTSGDVISVTITRRVGATFGPTSEFSAVGTVIGNDPPVADAGGPYTIAEGGDLVLDGSGTTDPDGDTLTYEWDLDNDGSYDDATGVAPTVTWASLAGLGLDDDGGPFPVGLRVDDTITTPHTDSTSLTITNMPPSLTASGPATIGAGQLLTLTLGATDPGADTITSWTVNWGDGSTDTGPGPTATHRYTRAGVSHPITVSAVDEDGTWWGGQLLVPSYLTGTIVPLSADGAVGTPFGSLGGPFDTVFGPDGNLYVTDYPNDTVERYDAATGTHLGTFVAAGSGGLDGPAGLAFGADGHLYVASSFTSTVERYDGATGTHLGTFVTAGSGGLVTAQDVIFGPDGHLYVGGRTSGAVHRYDGATGASMGDFVAAGSGGLVRPEGLAFDDGDLLVASNTTDEVLRYDPTGAFAGVLVSAGSGGLDAPGGVAMGPDGDMYVTSELTDEVLRYTPTGTFVGPVAPAGAGGLDTPVYPSFAPAHLVTVTPTHTISGTVFEDRDYGGGPGRDQITAGGIGRGGATVELYDSGTYQTATVTATDGSYALPALDPGVYTIRVVNRTVTSSRTGSDGSEVPVQTFRVDGPSEAIGTGAARVGGDEPQSIDAPANDTTQSLSDLQAPAGVFTQTIVDVDATGTDVTGVDFGYSFGTVVNTNNGGQGSLRRMITNANLLGDDAGLAQDGHPAGLETAIFEIPTSDTGYGTSPVGFTMEPATPLPALVTTMALDASTQAQFATENRPVVELVGSTAAGAGLDVAADDSVIRGFAINRFDTGIAVTAGANSAIVGNHVGPDITGLIGEVGNTDGVVVSSATGTLIGGTDPADANLISGNVGSGVVVDDVADGPAVTAAGTVIEGNLIGADVTGTGPLPATGAGTPQRTGIELVGAHGTRIGGKDADAGNVISRHDGTGVAVIDATATDNAVVANSIVDNGALGIDLADDGVTANDPGDGDTGPNQLLNHPIITSATRMSAATVVLGTLDAPVGTYRIELFANPSGVDPSGSGEGEVYLGATTLTHSGSGPELWGAAVPAVTGDRVTATAIEDLTIAFGSTSELGPAETVVSQATARATDRSERRSDPLALGGLDPTAAGPGVAGPGLTFDGADDRLAGPALDITSPGLTLAGWVHRTSAGADPRVVSKSGAYELFVDSGTNEAVARIRIGGSTRVLSGGSAPVGAWHHLAATWDGATVRLFVDGAEVDTVAASGALGVDLDTSAVIGNTQSATAAMAGHLDQVVVLHRPLSAAALAAHAANVNAPSTFVAVGGQQTSATDPWTVTGTQSRSGSFALEAPQTNATSAAWAVASGIDEPGVVFESWWWFTDESAIDAAAGTRSGPAPTDEYEAALVGPAGWELRQRQGATESTDAPAAGSPAAGQWVKVEIWTDQNGESRLLIDDVEVTGWTAQGSALASGSIGLRAGYLSLSEDWWVDDAQARRLVTPEPFTTVGPLDRE
ncbi:MAG: right-handed parallel beta-helix repeat-containing protein [Acidimicrobiia bacterium]|nr:right-handed parallel beta-helix repeat-containing protein [Acidimicrobiia bacterium]